MLKQPGLSSRACPHARSGFGWQTGWPIARHRLLSCPPAWPGSGSSKQSHRWEDVFGRVLPRVACLDLERSQVQHHRVHLIWRAGKQAGWRWQCLWGGQKGRWRERRRSGRQRARQVAIVAPPPYTGPDMAPRGLDALFQLLLLPVSTSCRLGLLWTALLNHVRHMHTMHSEGCRSALSSLPNLSALLASRWRSLMPKSSSLAACAFRKLNLQPLKVRSRLTEAQGRTMHGRPRQQAGPQDPERVKAAQKKVNVLKDRPLATGPRLPPAAANTVHPVLDWPCSQWGPCNCRCRFSSPYATAPSGHHYVPAAHRFAQAALFGQLSAEVLERRAARRYDAESLMLAGKLLELHPEVYTAWNYRREALQSVNDCRHDFPMLNCFRPSPPSSVVGTSWPVNQLAVTRFSNHSCTHAASGDQPAIYSMIDRSISCAAVQFVRQMPRTADASGQPGCSSSQCASAASTFAGAVQARRPRLRRQASARSSACAASLCPTSCGPPALAPRRCWKVVVRQQLQPWRASWL